MWLCCLARSGYVLLFSLRLNIILYRFDAIRSLKFETVAVACVGEIVFKEYTFVLCFSFYDVCVLEITSICICCLYVLPHHMTNYQWEKAPMVRLICRCAHVVYSGIRRQSVDGSPAIQLGVSGIGCIAITLTIP